jgi:hypothetical protein
MLKYLLAAVTAAALIAAPVTQTLAQATAPAKTDTTKTETAKTKKTKAKKEPAATEAKTEKKLTPQQQKMKDCAVKWKEEKATKKVSGRAAYNKFMSGCLKNPA